MGYHSLEAPARFLVFTLPEMGIRVLSRKLNSYHLCNIISIGDNNDPSGHCVY